MDNIHVTMEGRSYSQDEGSYDQLLGLGIGLSGAHRTGKSTIAKKLAEDRGWTYVESIAGGLVKEMGLDVSVMTWEDRIRYQTALFNQFKAFYEAQTEPFIADRTPLDLATYLLMDLPPVNHPTVMEYVNKYVQGCLRMTQQYHVIVGLVQPGIPYVEEPDKPVFDSARQEKFNFICRGLISDDRMSIDRFVVPRDITDFEERVDYIAEECGCSLKSMMDSWELLPRA